MIRSTKKGRIGKGRSSVFELIQIEITNLNLNPITKNYVIEVQDYSIVINSDLSVIKTPIGALRYVTYPKEKINGLFQYLNNPIEVTEAFTDEFCNLLDAALLYVTQTELDELKDENGGAGIFVTNYELQPQDWVIITD